ncbi:hypothetical protein RDI58_010859 [Solanum bulbocastanum]|uniref:Uncharacterized protein n=1 Tax=Solanum bulbocastanum TaxID=147425 RepID=A0AAN8TNP8_SOLBU
MIQIAMSFSEVLTIQQTHFYLVSIYQMEKSCSRVPGSI